ncbi:MAG: hypothetical protein RL441_1264 [Actinomycetota bacterium]|jgi:O-succinylbenzoic acid--CoA ligase
MSKHFRTVQVQPGPEGAFAALEAVHELFEDEVSVALVPAGSAASLAAVDESAPLHTDEPTLIVCTSGSTGQPRGVELTVTALGEAAALSAMTLGSQSVWLAALPVTSIGGLNPLLRSALAGTAPVIWDGIGGAYSFEAEEFIAFMNATLVSARKQKLTSAISLVPTQLHRLAGNADALATLALIDHVLVGGGAVPAALAEQVTAAGVRLVRTYGSTETAGGVVYNATAFEGVSFEFDADQRVTVQSPTLAHCYRDGEPIAATGWRSSDRGELVEGRLSILGRVDDIIKVAGHNVDLKRVAAIAESVSGLDSCAVTSAEDAVYGRVPVIAVVGGIAADVEAAVRAGLEGLSIPLRVHELAALPMLTNGKPDLIAIAAL